MRASPLVLAALEQAETSNATVNAILTFKLVDRSAVKRDLTALVEMTAAETHESVEELDVFPVVSAVRIKAHPHLIRALLARPEAERANSGFTQAPFAFGGQANPTA